MHKSQLLKIVSHVNPKDIIGSQLDHIIDILELIVEELLNIWRSVGVAIKIKPDKIFIG